MHEISAFALPGIPEVESGDSISKLILDALSSNQIALRSGDILAVTSKIVSKAEGRFFPESEYNDLLKAETSRVVATSGAGERQTRIVESRLGIVAAAAGIDRSNAPEGQILGLPLDPDGSAATIRKELENALEIDLGVIITDTSGRAWRVGQTDIVIGASGVQLLIDLNGEPDANGRELVVTAPAVGDELAAMADLVKAKSGNTPVAVIRGMDTLLNADAESARSLVRERKHDMFSHGAKEAYQAGVLQEAIYAEPFDWQVIVLGRGGGKSRINVDPKLQNELADAFALDTVTAFLQASRIESVTLLTTSAVLAERVKALSAGTIIADATLDMNAQILEALKHISQETPVIVVVGDLPQVQAVDITSALELASFNARSVLADRVGTGTTLLAAKTPLNLVPEFGTDSFKAHHESGFVPILLPVTSRLRDDIDTLDDLKRNLAGLGAHSRAVLPDEFID